MTRRSVEIESLAEFDARLARTDRLDGWFVQSLDLTDRGEALARVDPRGAVFLGCRLTPSEADDLTSRGALLFPELPDLPFLPYRSELYTADELLGDGPYPASTDAQIYAWAKSGRSRRLDGTLAVSLHDHAVENALSDLLGRTSPERVVGVMGGHALRRGEPAYADAAELGRALARGGKVVLTGGGPGAMEAANLGARLAGQPDDALPAAVELLSAVPSFAPSVDDWLAPAREVLARWPDRHGARITSLGIPTWFYGHEPPNPFGQRIAKYFANPLREDTLLHRCRGGIVFLPGAAGTVSEIFTSATENYYATDAGRVAPMVLLGRDYWERELPAWPVLAALGTGRPMAAVISCVDDVNEAAGRLLRPTPSTSV